MSGEIMSGIHWFNRRFRHQISRSAVIALVALSWVGFAFCGSIFQAASEGDSATIKAYLTGNSDLALIKDPAGETPLHFAALKGHKDAAALLLSYGANVNAKDNYGETPLHAAAAAGFKNVAELLLANKADVNARDSDGDTPLHAAAAGGYQDVMELLRRHGGHE
jgi:ankyrin repeat protein